MNRKRELEEESQVMPIFLKLVKSQLIFSAGIKEIQDKTELFVKTNIQGVLRGPGDVILLVLVSFIVFCFTRLEKRKEMKE